MRSIAVNHALNLIRHHGLDLPAQRCLDVGGTRKVYLETERLLPPPPERRWKDLLLLALGEPLPPARKEVVVTDNPLLQHIPQIQFYDWGFNVTDLDTTCDIRGDFLKEQDVAPLLGAYDLVLSFDTLEHIHDPFTFCRNLARVTRPGGHIYVSTVFSWAYHPSPQDYYRFSPEGLRRCFQDSGTELLACGWDVPEVSVFIWLRRAG